MKYRQYQKQLAKMLTQAPGQNVRRWQGLYYDELTPKEKIEYCRAVHKKPGELEEVYRFFGWPLHFKIEPPGQGLTLEELEKMVRDYDPDEEPGEL